jgi:hypothetical protein
VDVGIDPGASCTQCRLARVKKLRVDEPESSTNVRADETDGTGRPKAIAEHVAVDACVVHQARPALGRRDAVRVWLGSCRDDSLLACEIRAAQIEMAADVGALDV